LFEEHLDVLGAVDLADARQLVVFEISNLDGWLHAASFSRWCVRI
jgi:hypothetical protein